MFGLGRCALCDKRREAESEFCDVHITAHKNLKKGFAAWSRAFGGGLSEQEYWTELEGLTETGQAVKEMIKRLKETRVVG